MHTIKISSKHAKNLFDGCSKGFIENICKGACCRSKSKRKHALIFVEDSKREALERRGAVIVNNLIETTGGRCPFQSGANLCDLHGSGDKPLSCTASPFSINKNDTLVIGRRYYSLSCYNKGTKTKAYIAYFDSLMAIFGVEGAKRIKEHLDMSDEDFFSWVDDEIYVSLKRSREKRKEVIL